MKLADPVYELVHPDGRWYFYHLGNALVEQRYQSRRGVPLSLRRFTGWRDGFNCVGER